MRKRPAEAERRWAHIVAFRQDQRQANPFGNPVIDVEETADVPRGPCLERGLPNTPDHSSRSELLTCSFRAEGTKVGMLNLGENGHWELLHTRTASTAGRRNGQSAYEERDRVHDGRNE